MIPHVNSLPGRLDTLQDIKFHVNFEQSLFHSKYLSCIDQIVVDSSVYFDNPLKTRFHKVQQGHNFLVLLISCKTSLKTQTLGCKIRLIGHILIFKLSPWHLLPLKKSLTHCPLLYKVFTLLKPSLIPL